VGKGDNSNPPDPGGSDSNMTAPGSIQDSDGGIDTTSTVAKGVAEGNVECIMEVIPESGDSTDVEGNERTLRSKNSKSGTSSNMSSAKTDENRNISIPMDGGVKDGADSGAERRDIVDVVELNKKNSKKEKKSYDEIIEPWMDSLSTYPVRKLHQSVEEPHTCFFLYG